MNNLNSTLSEGTFKEDPKPIEGGCTFTIGSVRNKKTRFFSVVVYGKESEDILKRAKKGRGARVVGYLCTGACGMNSEGESTFEQVYIVAEHVELRPESKSRNSTQNKSRSKINKE